MSAGGADGSAARRREPSRPDPDDAPADLADAAGHERPPAVRVEGAPTCPLCLDALTAEPSLVVCPACRTIHHASCAGEMARCATPGCQGLRGGTGPDPSRGARGPESEGERVLAALAHLAFLPLGLLWPFLGFVCWRLLRRSDAYLARHVRQSLLFLLVSPLFVVGTLGLFLPVALVLMVRATGRAYRGDLDPYGGVPLLSALLERLDPPPGPEPRAPSGPAGAPGKAPCPEGDTGVTS